MALTKKGEFWYGTTSGDTQAELRSYSVANRRCVDRLNPPPVADTHFLDRCRLS